MFVQLGEDDTTHRYVPIDATGKAWPDAMSNERALQDVTTCVRRVLSE